MRCGLDTRPARTRPLPMKALAHANGEGDDRDAHPTPNTRLNAVPDPTPQSPTTVLRDGALADGGGFRFAGLGKN